MKFNKTAVMAQLVAREQEAKQAAEKADATLEARQKTVLRREIVRLKKRLKKLDDALRTGSFPLTPMAVIQWHRRNPADAACGMPYRTDWQPERFKHAKAFLEVLSGEEIEIKDVERCSGFYNVLHLAGLL